MATQIVWNDNSQSRTVVSGNTSQTAPENRASYPALDGVRAAAFFAVFAAHYLHLPWAWAGVDVFFVLSGFLITGILFDTRNDRHRVRNFYIRRSLRIFPLYYGVLLALFAMQPFAHWLISWKWLVWPAYLGNFVAMFPYRAGTDTQELAEFRLTHGPGALHLPSINMGHFWSLCVEEQFYLVWPWVVFQLRNRRVLVLICALSVPTVLALRVAASHLLPAWMIGNEVLYRVTPFRLDALLLGGLLALLLRGSHAEQVKRCARLLVWPCWTLAVACAYVIPAPNWRLTYGLLAVDLLSFLLIATALQTSTLIARIFSLPLLRWIGRLTYGAYVFHDMFHAAYTQAGKRLAPGHPVTAGALIAFLCTLFIAWLSFRFLESPFIRLKQRWTA